MTSAILVCDLQYGSTGKGLLAGHLAKTEKPDVVACAFTPNAGHTFIDSDGTKYIHSMIPNGIVSPRLEHIMIGPGAVIDFELMKKELTVAKIIHHKNITLHIHPMAGVLHPRYIEEEKDLVRIGSTMKGTSGALIAKIRRDPKEESTVWTLHETVWERFTDFVTDLGIRVSLNRIFYNQAMDYAQLILLEGAQGYSLSLDSRFWPYVTSKNVTPRQIEIDCALPGRIKPHIWGTLRTLPIRVANRMDKSGTVLGTSGPGYPDQEEISWDSLGLEPELTTVTKLPRRVFTFSRHQIIDAARACGPDSLFLNFCNYIQNRPPEGGGIDSELFNLIEDIETICMRRSRTGHGKVHLLGWGPTINDLGAYSEARAW